MIIKLKKMEKSTLSKVPCGYRWIVSALVCICAFSLSAQTYYRVHKDEFANITKYLNDYAAFFSFAIVSPENGVAMSTTINATIQGIEVELSDDFGSMTAKDSDINFQFESIDENVEGSLEYPIRLINPFLSALGATQNNGNYRFTAVLEPYNSSTQFKVVYDSNDNGSAHLGSNINNTNLSIGYSTTEGGNYAFKLLTDESPALGIYRLDYFNWTIDESNLSDNGTLTIKSMLSEKLTSVASYIDIHYVINDGEDVSFEELINSQNRLEELRIKKGQELSVSIPVEDATSRSNNDNNTVWILPLLQSDGDLVPLGKVITKKYADDGVSTGIVVAMEDAEAQEPVYYTLDGRQAAMPLAPGVYVRRIGDKADKVVIR